MLRLLGRLNVQTVTQVWELKLNMFIVRVERITGARSEMCTSVGSQMRNRWITKNIVLWFKFSQCKWYRPPGKLREVTIASRALCSIESVNLLTTCSITLDIEDGGIFSYFLEQCISILLWLKYYLAICQVIIATYRDWLYKRTVTLATTAALLLTRKSLVPREPTETKQMVR